MKTKTINVYSFDELSEDAKQKAIEKLCDINVDYGWWEFTYEDAKTIGLKLTEFDLDRNRHAKGNLLLPAFEVCDLIIKNHGENCETYKDAKQFLKDYDIMFSKYEDDNNKGYVHEDKEYDFDNELQEMEDEFLKTLLEDYSIILQNECDYLMGEDAIKETIIANEYEFDEDGYLI